MYYDLFDIILLILLIFSCGFLVRYTLLKQHEKNAIKRAVIKANFEQQKILYPLKVKAVERFSLFIERLKIENLTNRIKPISEFVDHYKLLLIATIEQEFNHNAVQHIYISSASYQLLIRAKNSIINQIESDTESSTIADYKESILKSSSEIELTIASALSSLKRELNNL
ncbi:MAG: hypothetical protein L3J45_06435 [Flavobacteriaceae bacterium]|nr:hypothetical protein [Flavobacteriaceae bacterium]